MKVEYTKHVQKQLKKLDNSIKKKILVFLENLETLSDPRSVGKPLVGNFRGFWRYRVGDYRLICKIEDKKLIIVIVEINHRKNIYN